MPVIRLSNGMRISALSRLDAALLYHEIFTQATYAKHGITVDDGDCVFDVGANIGMFSLALAHTHRRLRLFLFEPVPAIFAALQQNAACHLSEAEAHLFNVGLAAAP